ncbi:outer membrane protein [Sphingomonas prati]|uniref:Outer membrane immunogenic protein n=1 Tax=Sphingomonas prati TaxID=1843237 RepID=A0A7W9BQR6_9SPHN|nr:porin family protein [Sphingomonas prati]MBB5728398.1 outer membrane immunogenic protein [Sphingomonas prati]GGE74111.1 hypothetical protein GCM10011404_03270 [Sphingomonas prati]
MHKSVVTAALIAAATAQVAFAQDTTTPAPDPTTATAPATDAPVTDPAMAAPAPTDPSTAAPAPTDTAAPAPAPADTAASYTKASSTGGNGTSFRGFRVEGQVGYDRFQSQGTNDSSIGYGGLVGFDGQIGDKIVVGAEGTIWNSDGENCTPGVSGGTVCHKSFQEYGAAVRAGYLVTPQVLVYGKAGFVNNEQRKSFSGVNGAGGFYDHFNTDGYQLGGGAEYSLNDKFYVNAEYKYSQYSDHTARQRALLGAGFRFK